MSLMEQELLTLPGHLSSPPVFSGVRVTRSLVLYVCFVDLCLSFCTIFLLSIVLSVRLRYTDSDYPYGIFKLFFWHNQTITRPITCTVIFIVYNIYILSQLLLIRMSFPKPIIIVVIIITIIIYNKKRWGDFVWGGYKVGASLLTIRAILTGVIL